MNSDKVPLELVLEIGGINENYNMPTRLVKVLYAGFIPQHGMQVMDTEIFFRVTTIALAGLQGLRHTASPLVKNNFIQGDRKTVLKLFPRNDNEYRDSVEFFIKQGWKVER